MHYEGVMLEPGGIFCSRRSSSAAGTEPGAAAAWAGADTGRDVSTRPGPSPAGVVVTLHEAFPTGRKQTEHKTAIHGEAGK